MLKHPQAVLQLLRVFTGDERYKDIETGIIADSQRGETMGICCFAERMERQGIIKGKIETILESLEDLGMIPDDVRARIMAETDEEVLKRWNKLAARANSMEEFTDVF